ncbi:amino acid ABC transporter permease [Actinoallomurus bryophytorum]|uniref:Glutamate transport system permease protein n=1 Tax=Actinoallomurus bryophytorum TaxID=1490222 RepID=A0A543CDL6_9ACTN|nr:glutamate transport system permease protein [Actinoallomurus bryophytorum]
MTMPADTQAAAPARRPSKSKPSVLFDAPGPRARLRNNVLTLIAAVVLLFVVYLLIARLSQEHQFSGKLWEPFTEKDVWTRQIIPGLGGTLKAAVVASVFALVFGLVFGLGRLSEHKWVSVPAGAVVEFFRAIPLLIMIFFAQAGPPAIMDAFGRVLPPVSAFLALVIGLTLYNGSVLAEIFRSGINSIPKGQSEAGYSIGLRRSGVMLRILVPQAVTAMMPAVISQLVVLLKDTALGYIIAYNDLLNAGLRVVSGNFGNIIPSAIVIAVIYIIINILLGLVATWLEKRSRRSRKTSARTLGIGTGVPPAAGMGSL